MKIKKLISCLAAVAMLTATVPMAFASDAADTTGVHQLKAAGENVFEIEDFYPELKENWNQYWSNSTEYKHHAENELASGGEFFSSGGWFYVADYSTKEYTAKINAPVEGKYGITFVAGQKVSNTSNFIIYVNDTQAVQNGDGSVTKITDPFVNNGFLRENYAEVNLTKGENIVKLYMDIPSGYTRAAGAIDTISFRNLNPIINAPELGETVKYEVEDLWFFPDRRMEADENASGGIFVRESYDSSLNREDYAKINVAEDGEYKINFVMEDSGNQLSRITLKVDGNSVLTNNTSNGNTNNNYDKKISVSNGIVTNTLTDYYGYVYLKKGEHELVVEYARCYDTNNAQRRDAYSLDTLSIKNATPVLKAGAEKNTYEFEDIWNWGKIGLCNGEEAAGFSAGTVVWASGGKLAFLNGNIAKIEVSESGLYKVSFAMEEAGTVVSKIIMKIDDKRVIQNYSDSTEVNNAYTDTGLKGYSKNVLDYYGYIYLTKGTHKFNIEYVLNPYNTTRHAVVFDALAFEKASTAQISESGAGIEAETYFKGVNSNDVVEDSNAFGGAYLSQYSMKSTTLESAVNVEKTGWYDLSLFTNQYTRFISWAKLNVDGSEVLNTKTAANTALDKVYPNETYQVKKFTAASPVYLTAGVHNISVDFGPATDSNDLVVKYKFDRVDVTPYGEDLTFTADLDDIAAAPFYISEDEEPTTETIVVKLNGGKIENGSTYQITYKSSNEEVMTVSADGEITPKKAGYSDVSVAVGIGGNTLETFSERVYVLDETYYRYIANAKYANGKLTFDAIDGYEDTGFAATAYAAVYTGDTLTDVDIVALNENDTEYEANVTAKTGDTIMIFVWDANYAPVWFATEVK